MLSILDTVNSKMGQFISCGSGSRTKKLLYSAINEGNVEYLEHAIADNPSLLLCKYSYVQYTPVHAATASGHLQILTILLERGANIDAKDRYGRTPLMIACKRSRWTCVSYLLDNGANVLIFSFRRQLTCLHYAAKYGHVESIQKILVAAKSSTIDNSWGAKRFVNVRDRYGLSALHVAARKGHLSVVRLLLENGALVSATTYTIGNEPGHGSTPLHMAARSGSIGCVQELLAWGADRSQMDYTGCTPFDIALNHRHFACATILDPDSAEPLVWPSPLKFMQDIDAEAKNLLETALLEANEARKYKGCGASTSNAAHARSSEEKHNHHEEKVIELETVATSQREVCCICFEEMCTIEVGECGHQMCAVCTLTLCSHSKPNPTMPYNSPPPACPFCRRDIANLAIASSKSNKSRKSSREGKEAMEPEKKQHQVQQPKRRNRKSRSASSKESFAKISRVSSGLGSSRVLDEDWFRISQHVGIS